MPVVTGSGERVREFQCQKVCKFQTGEREALGQKFYDKTAFH